MEAAGAVLGVNVAGTTAYLALVGPDGLVKDNPIKIDAVGDFTRPRDVAQTRDSIFQLLQSLRPLRTVILKSEATAPPHASRSGVETLVLLCVADLGLAGSSMARPTVRSRLALPRSGKFGALVPAVFPLAIGTHWAHRGPAALAARAELVGVDRAIEG